MKIEELGLSVRPYNVLKRARIDTVEQLQQLSDDDLMRLRNMGRHSLEEIREKVAFVKTMTNADRIRSMDETELVRFLDDVHWTAFEAKGDADKLKYPPDTITWREWLQQPAVKEEPHGS